MTENQKAELRDKIGQVTNIKGIYKGFLEGELEVLGETAKVKDQLLAFREEEASIQNLRKKNGDLDVSAVPASALTYALSVYSGGEDKLEVLAEQKDKFLKHFRDGEIDEKTVKSHIKKEEALTNKKTFIKDEKDKLKEQYDPIVIDGVYMLAKEEGKIIYEARNLEEGKKPTASRAKESREILLEIKKSLGLD